MFLMTSGVHHVASRGSGALIKRAEERRAGRLKGLSFLVCIAQKESVDELASFSNPFTSLALFFLRFAPSKPPLLPRDAEMQKFSLYRCCRRRIGRKKRGGNAARRWSPSQERARARLRAKGKKKSRSAPNLVSASSFFSGCPPPLLSLSLSSTVDSKSRLWSRFLFFSIHVHFGRALAIVLIVCRGEKIRAGRARLARESRLEFLRASHLAWAERPFFFPPRPLLLPPPRGLFLSLP